ncbi:MAG TPA: hypothetical protein VK066_20100 [Chloroflexota bacterium]|nr:hypothetical protein [Chloroflexota bacterium]
MSLTPGPSYFDRDTIRCRGCRATVERAQTRLGICASCAYSGSPCPRCGGRLASEPDEYGPGLCCIQCAYAPPPTDVLTGRRPTRRRAS